MSDYCCSNLHPLFIEPDATTNVGNHYLHYIESRKPRKGNSAIGGGVHLCSFAPRTTTERREDSSPPLRCVRPPHLSRSLLQVSPFPQSLLYPANELRMIPPESFKHGIPPPPRPTAGLITLKPCCSDA